MISPELERLARTGAVKREPASRNEYDNLVRSGEERLADAGRTDLASSSRFDLGYNAGHAPALAALRRLGYRAPSRRLVFEALAHTTTLDEPSRRVLIKCHERRNFAEYEGIHDIDDRLLGDLIKATGRLLDVVRGLTPPEPGT